MVEPGDDKLFRPCKLSSMLGASLNISVTGYEGINRRESQVLTQVIGAQWHETLGRGD